MLIIYKSISWVCYWLGDLSCKVMCLLDNYGAWTSVWYPIYNKFMIWSSDMQDYAGFDPTKTNNTAGWPWGAPEFTDKEEE